MTIHESRVRVRYAETDQMGVVYHANYLVWMEVGRVEYCRAAGIRYIPSVMEVIVSLGLVALGMAVFAFVVRTFPIFEPQSGEPGGVRGR